MQNPTLRYTLLASALNALIDGGHTLSIAEVQARVRDGSLLDRLAELGADVSLYDAGERRAICDVFRELESNSVAPDFGVAHNGLALCLAYCIEVLQWGATSPRPAGSRSVRSRGRQAPQPRRSRRG